ncbi:MAG: cytochrome P450 [Parvibaculum sp.]|nr:cytochrome P450 [Parvibaculum sp.]
MLSAMDLAPQTDFSLRKPLKFNVENAAFKRDPFPTLGAMRAAGPVIPIKFSFVGKVWVTTTHAATLGMVKDNELFVQEGRNAGKAGVAGMTWWMPKSIKLLANNMLLKDEPDHRRLRKLVDRAFQRRGVMDMRADIEALADKLLDEIQHEARPDLANDYSRRLPLEVICELLGIPDQDRKIFGEWSRMTASISGPFGLLRAMKPLSKMIAYVRVQINECRLHPRDGLISELVCAEDEGEKLDENELVAMVLLLLVAGFETTTHLINDSIIALEQNPAQKAFLLADPAARMERSVEELARFTTPVQLTKPRYVARDCTFFGQPLKRGDIIMAFLASANADPAEFNKPDTLDLERFPNPHLVFSSGIHFCLGMQLARVETQSALKQLYERFPNLEIIEPDRLVWMERLGFRGVTSLPVRLR